MRKRYEDALNNQSDGGNTCFEYVVVNFAASVQQYAQVAAIFLGVYLIVDGQNTRRIDWGSDPGRTNNEPTLTACQHLIEG